MLDLIQINAPAFIDLLDENVVAKIKKAATLMKYSDGQLIHSRGTMKPGLSIVHTGSAQVGVNGFDGIFVMAALLGPGECFGEFTLFTDLPRTHDISAVGVTEVFQLNKTSFDALYADEPSMSRALLQMTLVRTHILLEMLDAIRRLPILERTAKVVLSMLFSAGDSNILRCRQSELAYTLGVSRVSLGKALKQLCDLGLLELGYGYINIPNRENLEAWVSLNCAIAPH